MHFLTQGCNVSGTSQKGGLSMRHEKVLLQELQKNVGERVKKYIRKTLYSKLKFCEHDHIDGAIYTNWMEQEDIIKPNRIDDDEYKKAVKTAIKQGFSSRCHNSQTRKTSVVSNDIWWSTAKKKNKCKRTTV